MQAMIENTESTADDNEFTLKDDYFDDEDEDEDEGPEGFNDRNPGGQACVLLYWFACWNCTA